MGTSESIDELTRRVRTGDRRAAARLIALAEDHPDASHAAMKRIYPHTGRALLLGVTGAGGAGKSTLVGHLVGQFRQQGKRVGAILIDPTSPFSGGSFLGDRVRMGEHALDDGVFIRSMATRGYHGGLARAASAAMRIIEAMGMHVVIVETVGVGQEEIDVIQLVQTSILVVTPSMGDDMQAMKAGILEAADLIVLNKADLDEADRCLKHLNMSLELGSAKKAAWRPRLIPTVSVAERSRDIQGIDELMAGIAEHGDHLKTTNTTEQLRERRVEREIRLILRDRLEGYAMQTLDGTARKREYIERVLQGRDDPYSVVEAILGSLPAAGQRRHETEERV
jgi:LAO/AO transport system kinase